MGGLHQYGSTVGELLHDGGQCLLQRGKPQRIGVACEDGAGLLPHRHHGVDTQLRRQCADLAVCLLRQCAQFTHVAQHRHTAGHIGLGKGLQRLRHSLGVGVVAVIDDDAAIFPHHTHTAAHRGVGGNTTDDLLFREAEVFAHRHRHRGRIDHKRTGGWNVHGVGRLLRGDGAVHTLDAPLCNVADADITVLPLAAQYGAEIGAQFTKEGIIAI